MWGSTTPRAPRTVTARAAPATRRHGRPVLAGQRANRNPAMPRRHDHRAPREFPVWSASRTRAPRPHGRPAARARATAFSAGNWEIANTSPCFITRARRARCVGASSSCRWARRVVRRGAHGKPTLASALDHVVDKPLDVDCGGQFRCATGCGRTRTWASTGACHAAADAPCPSLRDHVVTPSTAAGAAGASALAGLDDEHGGAALVRAALRGRGRLPARCVQGLSAECTNITTARGCRWCSTA